MSNISTEQMQHVIERYFQMWRELDTEGLGEIFAENAVYHVQPFDVEVYEGLEAIKQYWRDHPVKKQIHPTPRIIKVAYGHNCVFVEWETIFTTHEQTRKTVRGMMVLEFENAKLKQLREHFATKVENI